MRKFHTSNYLAFTKTPRSCFPLTLNLTPIYWRIPRSSLDCFLRKVTFSKMERWDSRVAEVKISIWPFPEVPSLGTLHSRGGDVFQQGASPAAFWAPMLPCCALWGNGSFWLCHHTLRGTILSLVPHRVYLFPESVTLSRMEMHELCRREAFQTGNRSQSCTTFNI